MSGEAARAAGLGCRGVAESPCYQIPARPDVPDVPELSLPVCLFMSLQGKESDPILRACYLNVAETLKLVPVGTKHGLLHD